MIRADVNTLHYYYPFGATMPGRNFNSSEYRYGFQGYEKDNEWRNKTGADYDLEGYGYDALTGRRKSLDPKANQMPGVSPYAFGFNNPIYFIDPDGEFPWPFGKDAKRRKKPKIGNNIRGTGLVVWLGGTRGKYFKHNSLHRNNIPKPQPNDNFANDNVPKDPTTGKPKSKESDNSNPLERDTRFGEDRSIDDRVDFNPKFNEGEFEVTFDTELDDEGNTKEATIQIGKIDKDGNEVILQETTTNEPGTVKAKFKLEKGEKLFQRTKDAGSTKTKATKEHEE